MKEIMKTLTPAQQKAVEVVKLSLDCFNSMDGAGLFTGVSRYNALVQRLPLAAVQSRTMPSFWAALMRHMRWEIPPKRADKDIARALACDDAGAVLRTLATEASSVVTLARMLHDADKATRRSYLAPEEDDPAFNPKEIFSE